MEERQIININKHLIILFGKIVFKAHLRVAAMAKKILNTQLLGEKGVNLIARIFMDIGFTWHPTNAPVEAGIDGHVEIRDPQTGEVSNVWLAVQSKARTNLEKETETSFQFSCTRDDLEYWRQGNMPIILVVSKPDTSEAWWVSVKDYFSDISKTSNLVITFNKKEDALTIDSRGKFVSIGIAAGSSTYFRPSPRPERLFSNLLKIVRTPSCLYRADALFTDPAQIYQILKTHMDYPPVQWVLHDKTIYSVFDLRNSPWQHVCDRGTVETIETHEWSLSSDHDITRRYVWLLNRCLGPICRKLNMRYDKEDDGYFFKATKSLSSRKILYKSHTKNATRVVFGAIYYKKYPDKLTCYRHVGFRSQFIRIQNEWYLQIEPTYRFTSDGYKKYAFHEEYLSKIKSIEGSGAVGGIVVMFADILSDKRNLFAENDENLGFGKLLELEFPVSINEASWGKDSFGSNGDETNSENIDDDVNIADGLFNEG